MNRSEQHPDSVLLDQLRAGLLDDRPQLKADIEQHLQGCTHCRQTYEFPAQLLAATPGLDKQLDSVRRQALAAQPARRLRPLLPLAATAALVLVAVVLVNLQPGQQANTPRVASSSQAEPDLYEDLDFYLWLADHKASGDSST